MNMFTNKDLRKLRTAVDPLEQFFQIFVGMADTFVVSYSSEADVSGVALVTSFNTILIVLFTALSAGGAVIISQYIGSKNKEKAAASASQLLMISAVISVILTILILLFKLIKAAASASQLLMISAVISVILTILILLFSDQILRLLFGKIEPDVMSACKTYLMIITWSLPALAVYDLRSSYLQKYRENKRNNVCVCCSECAECHRKLCRGTCITSWVQPVLHIRRCYQGSYLQC